MKHTSEQAAQFEQTDRHINRVISYIIYVLFVIVLFLALSLYLPT